VIKGEGFNTAEQLKSIIRQLEGLNDEAAEISKAKSDVKKLAKQDGFDVPTIMAIIKRRKMEPEKVLEADALLETYESAIGSGAAAAGILSTTRNADGSFEVKMVAGPDEAVEKLSKATKARQDAIALAELARMARQP
jgi:uncharacterized protein (UPF0335 family)